MNKCSTNKVRIARTQNNMSMLKENKALMGKLLGILNDYYAKSKDNRLVFITEDMFLLSSKISNLISISMGIGCIDPNFSEQKIEKEIIRYECGHDGLIYLFSKALRDIPRYNILPMTIETQVLDILDRCHENMLNNKG